MSDQPIIIEEGNHPKLERQEAKQRKQVLKTDLKKEISEQNFFTLLDGVEQYDALATKIRKNYQDAMLGLASVKFNNPHSLNINAHRCVPAFLRHSENQTLKYKYEEFSNKVEEKDVYFDEYEDQEQIESDCLEKQKKMNELKNPEDKQQFCENELLHRFNVADNHEKVIKISQQFKNMINSLLELHQCRQRFQKTIDEVEKGR